MGASYFQSCQRSAEYTFERCVYQNLLQMIVDVCDCFPSYVKGFEMHRGQRINDIVVILRTFQDLYLTTSFKIESMFERHFCFNDELDLTPHFA